MASQGREASETRVIYASMLSIVTGTAYVYVLYIFAYKSTVNTPNI